LKLILLGYQNIYAKNSSINNIVKSFDVLTTGLSVLYNHVDNSTKLFLNLAKFLVIANYFFLPYWYKRIKYGKLRKKNVSFYE